MVRDKQTGSEESGVNGKMAEYAIPDNRVVEQLLASSSAKEKHLHMPS